MKRETSEPAWRSIVGTLAGMAALHAMFQFGRTSIPLRMAWFDDHVIGPTLDVIYLPVQLAVPNEAHGGLFGLEIDLGAIVATLIAYPVYTVVLAVVLSRVFTLSQWPWRKAWPAFLGVMLLAGSIRQATSSASRWRRSAGWSQTDSTTWWYLSFQKDVPEAELLKFLRRDGRARHAIFYTELGIHNLYATLEDGSRGAEDFLLFTNQKGFARPLEKHEQPNAKASWWVASCRTKGERNRCPADPVLFLKEKYPTDRVELADEDTSRRRYLLHFSDPDRTFEPVTRRNLDLPHWFLQPVASGYAEDLLRRRPP